MEDKSCVHFLQWALPRMNMRWKGFKRVRRQVCRRIDKRLSELNIANIDQYRFFLETNQEEWDNLDRMCRITISRFYRNRVVFDYLINDVFPDLIHESKSQGCKNLRVWSCGCASGEEPYTIALIWHFVFKNLYPDIKIEIIATDTDPIMLKRAEQARYSTSSLRELPPSFVTQAFERHGETYLLKKPMKELVRFQLLDIREGVPEGRFHIVLCRNLAFTYFSTELQKEVLYTLCNTMEIKGVLITGSHETIAWEGTCFSPPEIEHMPFFWKA